MQERRRGGDGAWGGKEGPRKSQDQGKEEPDWLLGWAIWSTHFNLFRQEKESLQSSTGYNRSTVMRNDKFGTLEGNVGTYNT